MRTTAAKWDKRTGKCTAARGAKLSNDRAQPDDEGEEAKNNTHVPSGAKHAVELMLIEYKCLRDEIQARLLRISKLVMFLLTGFLVYATSIFVPLRFLSASGPADAPASLPFSAMPLGPIFVIYLALIAILPFVSFAIEIMCTSEEDAIRRTGIYIRENIERKLGAAGYRGWEDWLGRQDKALRRRTSETFATLSRYFIIMLYCMSSATITGLLVSAAFSVHYAFSIGGIFIAYVICGGGIYMYLREARNTELSPNRYDVLVLDIDGCLINNSGTISARNIEAIEAVKRLGVAVILATGRACYGMWNIMEQLNAGGLHAAAHGACIATWPDKRNDVLFPLDVAAVTSIIRELNASQVLWAVFGKSSVYCVKGKEGALGEILRARGDILPDTAKIIPISDLDSWSWHACEGIAKIWCHVGVSEVMKSNRLLGAAVAGAHSTRTTNDTVEFFSAHASKVKTILITHQPPP